MIQDINTAKKKKEDNFCGICRYCLYEDDAGGYICHNEKSVMYGEYLSDIGHEDCDKFSGETYTQMSLKDALKIMTGLGMLWVFLQVPGKDRKPFLGISFESNEQFVDWKDAHTRLFMEYMDLAEKDGDFKE